MWKGYILYGSNFMIFWKSQNIQILNTSVVCRVQWNGVELSRWSTGEFFLLWRIFSVLYYNCGYMAACICQNPLNLTAQRMNFNAWKFKMHHLTSLGNSRIKHRIWQNILTVLQMYERISLKGVKEIMLTWIILKLMEFLKLNSKWTVL